MFIEYGICKYPKAPEGRHVTFAQITDETDCADDGTQNKITAYNTDHGKEAREHCCI